MARTTQKKLLPIPFLLLCVRILGAAQKWVYMSQYNVAREKKIKMADNEQLLCNTLDGILKKTLEAQCSTYGEDTG
jgi:hypothetical protein